MAQHGAALGGGQVGVRERLCTGRLWAWNGLQGSGHSSELPELREHWLSDVEIGFGWCCVEPGVGLGDPCGSLPTLWFCGSNCVCPSGVFKISEGMGALVTLGREPPVSTYCNFWTGS